MQHRIEERANFTSMAHMIEVRVECIQWPENMKRLTLGLLGRGLKTTKMNSRLYPLVGMGLLMKCLS